MKILIRKKAIAERAGDVQIFDGRKEKIKVGKEKRRRSGKDCRSKDFLMGKYKNRRESGGKNARAGGDGQ